MTGTTMIRPDCAIASQKRPREPRVGGNAS
jgi:hypothetical protein